MQLLWVVAISKRRTDMHSRRYSSMRRDEVVRMDCSRRERQASQFLAPTRHLFGRHGGLGFARAGGGWFGGWFGTPAGPGSGVKELGRSLRRQKRVPMGRMNQWVAARDMIMNSANWIRPMAEGPTLFIRKLLGVD